MALATYMIGLDVLIKMSPNLSIIDGLMLTTDQMEAGQGEGGILGRELEAGGSVRDGDVERRRAPIGSAARPAWSPPSVCASTVNNPVPMGLFREEGSPLAQPFPHPRPLNLLVAATITILSPAPTIRAVGSRLQAFIPPRYIVAKRVEIPTDTSEAQGSAKISCTGTVRTARPTHPDTVTASLASLPRTYYSLSLLVTEHTRLPAPYYSPRQAST